MSLALARYPHLRAMVGAPLTMRDLPHAVGQVVAMLRGQRPPALPKPEPRRVRKAVETVTRPISALWGHLTSDEAG